jgi:hypothetical protein
MERRGPRAGCSGMGSIDLARAAHLHQLATQFRGFAAQTEWQGYRARMLELAVELDREAAKLDHYRLFVRPAGQAARAG